MDASRAKAEFNSNLGVSGIAGFFDDQMNEWASLLMRRFCTSLHWGVRDSDKQS